MFRNGFITNYSKYNIIIDLDFYLMILITQRLVEKIKNEFNKKDSYQI